MYQKSVKLSLLVKEVKNMYQIGLFSKMNRITTKTLRYYDEIGLLKPAYIDEESGYRYYSSEELPRLNKIIALKQMGMTLKEITEIIDSTKGIEILLNLKEKELEIQIASEKEKLRSIQSYKKRIKGEIMKYNPVIKELPEVIVASRRFIAPNYDCFFDEMPKMGEEMKRLGAVCAKPEYCFNIYHDGEYKEKDIDVEVCESVVDYCEDSEMVKFKKINSVPLAICILHKGPYTTLPDAYNFVLEWIEDNGYVIDGEVRESYIDGIWNKENEEDWLTEIQVPIKK